MSSEAAIEALLTELNRLRRDHELLLYHLAWPRGDQHREKAIPICCNVACRAGRVPHMLDERVHPV